MTSSWSYAVWAVIGAATVAMWALSHAASGRGVLVRPSAVLARLAGDPWLRVVLVVAWAWVGWHLFAR